MFVRRLLTADARAPRGRLRARILAGSFVVVLAGLVVSVPRFTALEPPLSLVRALGPVESRTLLARSSADVEARVDGDGLTVATGAYRLGLAAAGVDSSWESRRNGAIRRAGHGYEAVVFRQGETEELLSVGRHMGQRTWKWRLNTGGLQPRVGADGAVSFRAGHRLAPLAILPVAILDAKGRDVTPKGTRWRLEHSASGWWLALRLDDRKLPVPYIIDPTITHRGSVTANNGTFGGTSLSLPMPTGTAARDLLVAQVAVRGGTGVSVTPPAGWTAAVSSANGTFLRQASFYRIAAAGDPGSATFRFSSSAQAVGGISAYYGMKSSAVVDRFATAASSGNSATASAAAITTQSAGALVLTAFASAVGTTFSTPTGMSERYEAQSGSGTLANRASLASDSVVQAAAGSTGVKSTTITSSRWLAHILSFRVDDVAPTVSLANPGAVVAGTITLTATASDADSGVAGVQFQRASAGSGAWVNIGTPVTTAPYQRQFDTRVGDGLYDFRAVATDSAANAGGSAVVSGVRIDNTAPVSTTSFPASAETYNAAGWAAGCATQGLCGTANDSGSGVRLVDLSLRRSATGLYWNGSSFAAAAETFVAAALTGTSWSLGFASGGFPADGSYVTRVRATDGAGNAVIASRTFTYDATPPNTAMISSPPTLTSQTSISLAFTASETGSRFECRLDGGTFQSCTSPASYTGLTDGPHSFDVRAIDAAGNADATPAHFEWRVDTHGPDVVIASPAAGSQVSLTVAVTATAVDEVAVAGVQFAVDGSALGAEDTDVPYAASWNTRLATSGTHVVRAVARDSLGNTTIVESQVTVDNSGIPGPGLVAAYAFDEGQGAAATDGSGGGNTGTLVDAGWTAGKAGSSVFLDGVDDHVDLPPLGTFYRSGFTFEAWVMKRGTRKDVAVLGTWDAGGPMLWVDHVNGRYMLTIGTDDRSYLDSGRQPAVGQWQHVAGTWDGSVMRLYLNGVQVASRTFTGDPGASNVWRVGAYREAASGFFDGLVDDVRVYNRALPAAEIQGDMSASVGPADRTPPTAPAGVSVVSATATSVALAWTSSSDNLRVAGYNVYRGSSLAASPSAPSATISGLSCGRTYDIAIEAFDASGNTSPRTAVSVATATCDTTPPSVSVTSPQDGAVVGGVVILSATASDDANVASVQFQVDGVNVGAADTQAPYTTSWDTGLFREGSHAVSAVAHDTAGNQAVAQAQVTVDNFGAPDSGLVAAYGFDEGSGSRAGDGSGNANVGTLVGGAGWTAGKNGSAVSLDGVDDRVDLPALGTFYRSGFTLEAWAKKSGSTKDVAVVGTWEGGGPMVWIDHVNGHYMLTLGSGMTNYLDSGRTPTSGAWEHVAATYDGAVARFYVGGVQVASRTVPVDVGTSDVWRVGAYRASATGYYDGAIDDVRIYDRALSPAEVQADMTTPAAPDVYAPSVASVSPESGSTGVAGGASVTATFTEAIDPTSITSSTFLLRDAGGNVVPASVRYDASTRTAELLPQAALARATGYTASVVGGAGGVADVSGNVLRATVSWSFATLPAPQPILLVGSSANPFSRYAKEILEAEGLDEFETLDVSQLSAGALEGFDVVVLGDVPLTTGQVATLTSWVTGGGNLIALHPDKKLAGLLGLTDLGSTLSEGYLRVDTSAAPGTGIVGETMQFHGTADRYGLVGARAVATLYSDATTPTTSPAVTLRDVGSSGGHAVAFAFDLARSIVYTRQGNPAWAGQERDGVLGIRPDDLFFGGSITDPRPDWVDLSKIAIPQADEQQRLLANLITFTARDRKPLPRFWYFPRDLSAAIVMTGDDHGDNGTAGRFDQYVAASHPGCSVVDWECVRATSYTFTSTSLTDPQARAYTDLGFEVALHVAADYSCTTWSLDSAQAAFTSQLAAFAAKFPSVPTPTTNRTHCVTWDDWFTEPTAESAHGIRLDTNYYAFPAPWIATQPGFMTGSGMPMRFADLDGTTVDVYQALTAMDDEAGQPYPATVDALLDRALGPDGYYGFFVANLHADEEKSAASDAVIASAQARGVPVISARQLLDWLDARNASSFEKLSWNAGALTFDIRAAAGAVGLRAMLPLEARGATLAGITRDGTAVPYVTRTVKGVAYAIFPAVGGTYTASYG